MKVKASRHCAAVDVVVVGGGHCGLAMSHALEQRSIDHVVLERGEVANSWRTERWDSLRLLTPNWMTSLPGQGYDGDDPDGYMSAGDVATFLASYASRLTVPVSTGVTVQRVTASDGGYRVESTRGDWLCRALVMANGAFAKPALPAFAAGIPSNIAQLTAHAYRNPAALASGGVLIVGASATGVQLAHELQESGRQVTLAVGEHVRMPRVYRGQDIQWWMLKSGLLDQRIGDMADPLRSRSLPSPQLVGTPKRVSLDLNVLRQHGVTVVGRLVGIHGGRAKFSGSLRNVCALADQKMARLLDGFDTWALHAGIGGPEAGPRHSETQVDVSPKLELDLERNVRTVLWATGMRPDYAALDLPVFDRRGHLKHDRGVVVDAPGLYVLGLPFMRRRKSSFIHGAADDVRDVTEHLCQHLDGVARSVRSGDTRRGGLTAGTTV